MELIFQNVDVFSEVSCAIHHIHARLAYGMLDLRVIHALLEWQLKAMQMPCGTAVVDFFCVQSTESFWYWDIGPPGRWQMFVAEEPGWSELGKKPVLYPIIICTELLKIFNRVVSTVLLSELGPFEAIKKGKQKMLLIIGEGALPKSWVHRDHGRKRDLNQHLPCGISLTQWVTLNKREAFHWSPVDVNLVY